MPRRLDTDKKRKSNHNNNVKKKTSISIGKYYLDIIEREIENGKYGSVSEVICAGLRLIEKESVIK